jgi:glucokinase
MTAATLVADIGGTHFNAGLVMPGDLRVCHLRKLKAAEFGTPTQAVQAYLKSIASEAQIDVSALKQAAFAVATPVSGDRICFTNSDWKFSIQETRATLKLQNLCVINDFEALALSLPSLSADQYRAHGVAPNSQGVTGSSLRKLLPNSSGVSGLGSSVLAVVGPGTGLGVAAALHSAGRWHCIPGEGGHATLAAGSDFERRLLAGLSSTYPHVSAERLLSGIGMPVLYKAVAKVLGKSVENLATPAIVENGLARTDVVADQTIDVFCAMLGGFCGNVALTFGARAGLYIGGGIVPRLGERFFQSDFRQRFEAKGRFQDYLAAIPTAVITDPYVALSGAALALNSAAIST